MHIVFVHTPMASVTVPERELYWKYFDMKYYEAHDKESPTNNTLWELPHWVTWLGGVLVAEGFESMEVMDLYSRSETALDGLDLEEVDRIVKEHPADIFLFSPMTANLHFAFEIAESIKRNYPESTNIFGGVIATPLHRDIAANPYVDCVVYNRGEKALPELLKTIANRSDISKVGNLSYRNRFGKVVTNKHLYPYTDVGTIPFPKIDLFPKSAGNEIRYIRQVYAMGCPYECSFCSIQTIGRKPSYFPIPRVIKEIRAYREYYGDHHLYWGDETFTLHKGRTIELCNALEQEGDIKYDCQTRLNCLTDPEVIKALSRSGCKWIEIGIETGNQESQDLFKQRVKLESIEDTLRRIRGEGLVPCAFMLNAFPNQTLYEMEKSIEWVCSLLERDLLRASYFSNVVPFPGSPFFNTPEKMGIKLLHKDFKYYNEDLAPVFDSKYATSVEANEVFLKGLEDIAEAMSCNLSKHTMEKEAEFGAFWDGAHN